MMNFQERSWVRLALGMACCFSASCDGDDEKGSGRVKELFAATRSAIDAACACHPDETCGYIPTYECAGPTVERHEDELSDWIDCALAAYAELQACIDDSDCSEQVVSDCFGHHSPSEICEPIPEALDRQIDDELEVECPDPRGDDPLAGQR